MVTSWRKNITSPPLCKYIFILKRSRLVKFAEIIKIATMFIKTTFQSLNKVEKFRNYVLKCNLCFYFLIQKWLISFEKMLTSTDMSQACDVIYIYFRSFWVRYNCA